MHPTTRMSNLSTLTDEQIIAKMLLTAPPHVSKHRQADREGLHIRGRCFVADNSSIKKRMRAWRRQAALEQAHAGHQYFGTKENLMHAEHYNGLGYSA